MRACALLLSLAWPAHAAFAGGCLVRDDLVDGIRFVANGGRDIENHRLLDNGLIETAYRGTKGTWRGLLAKGVYLLEAEAFDSLGFVDENSRITYGYAVPSDRLPDPAAGVGATLDFRTRAAGGAYSNEQARYQFGAPETLSVGGCSYETMSVDVFYLSSEPHWHQHRIFFVALGTSVGLASDEIGSENSYRLEALQRLYP